VELPRNEGSGPSAERAVDTVLEPVAEQQLLIAIVFGVGDHGGGAANSRFSRHGKAASEDEVNFGRAIPLGWPYRFRMC